MHDGCHLYAFLELQSFKLCRCLLSRSHSPRTQRRGFPDLMPSSRSIEMLQLMSCDLHTKHLLSMAVWILLQNSLLPPPPSPHSQTSTLNFTNISSPAKLPGMPAFFLLVSSSESLILGPRQRATAVALHGALIIRLGFWVKHTITMIRKPQNSIGNYIFTIQKGWKTVAGNRRTRELMQNMVRRAAGNISTTHPTARSKKCRGP